MNFEGFAERYKSGFVLSDAQRRDKLTLEPMGTRVEPLSGWTTVRVNSTFIEVVDKFYPWRGVVALIVGPLFILFGPVAIFFVVAGMVNPSEAMLRNPAWQRIGFDLLLLVVLFALTAFIGYTLFAKEMFAYTHYPVRLNRKNKMVYVFRSNRAGGVLAVPWDEVFWRIAPCDRSRKDLLGNYAHEVRGHLLEADGVTVRDTFSVGLCDTEYKLVEGQWELLRKFMVGGPAQVGPQELLPLAGRREGFWFGMWCASRVLDLHAVLLLITCPLWASIGLARGLAMLTCRQPRWPADVEAACAVPPSEAGGMRSKDTIARVGSARNWALLLTGAVIGWICLYLFVRWVLVNAGYTRHLPWLQVLFPAW
jgi:hypothetical protein